MDLISIPHSLWHLYNDYLVYYQKGSWVQSIASTCRVLAFVLIIPFLLLMLLVRTPRSSCANAYITDGPRVRIRAPALVSRVRTFCWHEQDVASYVIARTLGVIDETKASTSGELEHPRAGQLHQNQPTIVVDDSDVSLAAATPLPPEHEHEHEDVHGNLKLSGVDTFSPAPSQPGSPTLQRREFMQHQYAHYGFDSMGRAPDTDLSSSGSLSLSLSASAGSSSSSSVELADGHMDMHGGRADREARLRNSGESDGDDANVIDGEGKGDGSSGATTPRDPSGHGSAGSSSGESTSSYAILDRDSGSEDAGVVLRRRATRQS